MITTLSDFNIRHLNTFRMNISVGKLIEYTSATDLPAVFLEVGDAPYLSIGAGSNLLFLGDFSGVLLHSGILDLEMVNESDSTVLVRAGSGIEMDKLIGQTCQAGLWGLENLSGIPGEVGASAVQNVGAYGVEVKDVIKEVECYDTLEKRFVVMPVSECHYGYRSSVFKRPDLKNRYIITHVTYRLSRIPCPVLTYGNLKSRFAIGETLTPEMLRNTIISIRDEKLPSVELFGSAGSFFKNPVVSQADYDSLVDRVAKTLGQEIVPPAYKVNDGYKLSAAWLIDKAGLKGISHKGAATWHTQPLVIINKSGKATPSDILELETIIIRKVQDLFGITLSPEVEHIYPTFQS